MTLGFSTKWPKHMGELAGQPNYFVEKIWQSFPDEIPQEFFEDYVLGFEKVNYDFHEDAVCMLPKLHTIRHDPHNRWKKGMKIHMVIYNRTKNRFQFAPVLECTGTQEIGINYSESPFEKPYVKIGDNILSPSMGSYEKEVDRLSINDGFPSIKAFFQYFHEDTKPNTKIIHWTDLRY